MAGLSRLLSDWPTNLFDRNFFDIEPGLFPQKLGVTVPTVNISETDKEYLLEMAAPGLQRSDFKIEIDDRVLTISSEKEESKEEKVESNGYTRKEYSFNSFARSFTLPEDINESDIDAKYENGVLKLTLPKVKANVAKKAKKIEVS
jgi:HSP20 family protein